MTFQMVRIGVATSMVSATGEITETTPDEFVAFLESNRIGGRPTIFLDSPGGRVTTSVEMGKLLRKVAPR